MKTITSTSGEEIEFSITSTRKIVIGTKPVKVTDLELKVLQDRLGNQIQIEGTVESTDESETSTVETTAKPTDSTEVKSPEEENASTDTSVEA